MAKRKIIIFILIFTLVFLYTAGCKPEEANDKPSEQYNFKASLDQPHPADDDDDDDDDDNDDDNNDDDYPPISIVSEFFTIDGPAPPPNPYNGAETPDEFNKLPMFRFRADTGGDEPTKVRSILIMLPGYSAGASQFQFMARDLITMAGGNLEVWVSDTRTNLFEDQYGMDIAEEEKAPGLAYSYYFHETPVYGHTFAGWLDPFEEATDMMTEWGLDLRMKEIRAMIEHVPEDGRAHNVFLGGHSRGARVVQMFAAYQFEDGRLGADDLAGILLLDGGEVIAPSVYSEESYATALFLLRSGIAPRFFSDWGGPKIFFKMQFYGMVCTEGYGAEGDERFGPDGFWEDWEYFEKFRPWMTRGHDVTLANAAFWGSLLDNNYTPFFNPFSGQMGKLTGGEITDGILGDYPSEDGATYYWLNYNESDPEELMDIQDLFLFTYAGPSDFGDPYFSSRLAIDDDMVGVLETENTWKHNYFKFYSSRMDAPVFALEGKILSLSNFYKEYREMLPSVRGSSAPRTRLGFEILEMPTWGHLEVLMVQKDRNPFYNQLLDWMTTWSVGAVKVPHFGDPVQ